MRSTPTRDPIGVSDMQSQSYAPEHFVGAGVKSARPYVASRAGEGRDTAASAGLTQMLSLVGTAMGARKVSLTSETHNNGSECHFVWRAPHAVTPPSTTTRTLLAFAPGAVLRARDASSVVIATFGPHIGVNLGVHAGREWRLVVERDPAAPALAEAEVSAILLLFEAFSASFEIWRNLQAQVERLTAMEELAHATSHAIIIVNADMTIVFANRRAETHLSEANGLVCSHARLSAIAFEDTIRLNAALHFVLRGKDSAAGKESPNPLITIRRANAPRLLVGVVPVFAELSRGGGALAALYIVDPSVDFSQAVDQLCQLYGLTPAETRLAKHLVCGLTLAAAAANMKIRLQTARGYLKQIFSKLEISRQADLIRLLMASIVPLRARCVPAI